MVTKGIEVRRPDGGWEQVTGSQAAELPVGTVFREDGGRPFRVEPPNTDENGDRYFTVSRVAE